MLESKLVCIVSRLHHSYSSFSRCSKFNQHGLVDGPKGQDIGVLEGSTVTFSGIGGPFHQLGLREQQRHIQAVQVSAYFTIGCL